MTAKGGFINEAQICEKFRNYQTDKEAQAWLSQMGYETANIAQVEASEIPVRISKAKLLALGISENKYEETIRFKKADAQIRVTIHLDGVSYIENISLKKANKSAGFNQVDKRPVGTYQNIWGFDDEIAYWLRLFTGDLLPKDTLSANIPQQLRKENRLFMDEIPSEFREKIISFFEQNKLLVMSDILRGRGGLSAEWFLVTRKNTETQIDWILQDINSVCNFYAQGAVELSPRGSLKVGRVTMQRKGGTPDPTSLQFKINPLALFSE